MKMPISRRDLLQILPAGLLASRLPAMAQASAPAALPPAPAKPPLTIPRAPKLSREARAIWMHPERYFSADGVQGRREVKAMMQRYADANFNLILPWTVSGYLAALESPKYVKAHPTAAWDSLGAIIEEAAAVGLDVDIWYSFTDYREPASPDFDPAMKGSLAWSARRLDEVLPDPRTGKVSAERHDTVCPQHFQARAWQQGLLDRTISRYPKLRGLHIEEPGYTTKDYCVCDLCQAVFLQLHGRALAPNLATQVAEDFRTIGTSAFMEELNEQLQAKHPSIVFSANGGPDWRHDRLRGRDWGRWGLSGWLRYYASQVYESDTATFKDRLGVTLSDIGSACPVLAGIALAWSEGSNTIDEVVRQIQVSRDLGAPGFALFHGAAFSDENLRTLKAGVFSHPA